MPGSLRVATIRPLSACATAFHFSAAPLTFVKWPASLTRWVPSSEASHTSPSAMYATDAACAVGARSSRNNTLRRIRFTPQIEPLQVPGGQPTFG